MHRITRLTIHGGKDARRGYYMAHPANEDRPSVVGLVLKGFILALAIWIIAVLWLGSAPA
jgi:hypothetical protein